MDATTSANTTRHELFVASDTSMRWKFTDSGVTLSPEGLSWNIGDVAFNRSYADIFSIRLQRAAAGTGANVGICQIHFHDGVDLHIHGGSEHGIADVAQAPRYTAFVRDLHRRLAAREDSKNIAFHAGLGKTRYIILTIAVAAAGLLMGVLPLILLIMFQDLHTLFLFMAGGGLAWSFFRLWDKNRPRPYSPGQVPEELLS
jgi:hypothetical protein